MRTQTRVDDRDRLQLVSDTASVKNGLHSGGDSLGLVVRVDVSASRCLTQPETASPERESVWV